MESKGQCKRCSYESWRLLPLLGGYICIHYRVFEYFSLVHIKKIEKRLFIFKAFRHLEVSKKGCMFFHPKKFKPVIHQVPTWPPWQRTWPRTTFASLVGGCPDLQIFFGKRFLWKRRRHRGDFSFRSRITKRRTSQASLKASLKASFGGNVAQLFRGITGCCNRVGTV